MTIKHYIKNNKLTAFFYKAIMAKVEQKELCSVLRTVLG